MVRSGRLSRLTMSIPENELENKSADEEEKPIISSAKDALESQDELESTAKIDGGAEVDSDAKIDSETEVGTVTAVVEQSNKGEWVEVKEKSGSETGTENSASSNDATSQVNISPPLTQHHVSHLLSEVLQEPHDDAPTAKLKFPIFFDIILAAGLLFAVGGFTIGLFHMYVVHSAAQNIAEQKYQLAIQILKSAPLPQFFARPGSDTEDMLSKATYLDAISRLESDDVKGALKELAEIKPGSKFFDVAQETINDNTEAAPLMLQGGAEQTDTSPPPAPQKSLVDKALNEE